MNTALGLLALGVIFIAALYIVEALPQMMREIFAAIGLLMVLLWLTGAPVTDVIVSAFKP